MIFLVHSWCEAMEAHGTQNPGDFVQLIYADRMRQNEDKKRVLDVYSSVFEGNDFPLYQKTGRFFIDERSVRFGKSQIKRTTNGSAVRLTSISIFKTCMNQFYLPQRSLDDENELFLMHNQTPALEALVDCVNMKWMTILVGDSCEGKTSMIHTLAQLVGHKLVSLAVNSQMDVTELLGGFEQVKQIYF